ncbi:MAG: phage tail tape measure protein [Sinimarinibacterium flocculans]|uniref:phage tail tape measure protein n=1 Tax=Sinimarinibacterium flocculans TaxID=985250 RepID=UPI003C384E59
MADRSVGLRVDLNIAGARAQLTGFGQTIVQVARDLQRQMSRVDAFRTLQQSLTDTSTALTRARERVRDLQGQLTAAARPTDALKAEFRAAVAEAGKLSREVDRQKAKLETHARALAADGVSTARLADEQGRLAQAMARVQAQARAELERVREPRRLNAAREVLDLRAHREIEQEVRRAQAAYERLRSSGKLTMQELAQAKARMVDRVAELRTGTNGWQQSLERVKGQLLAVGAALAGVVATASRGARLSASFQTRVAEVQTLSPDTPQPVYQQLGSDLRRQSVEIGRPADDLGRAAYDLVSAGIQVERVASATRSAAQAAVGGLTDVSTAAKVGASILNAYGLDVVYLDGVYDVLFQTVRGGITTFPELAANIGQVLPIAKSAGVGLQEVGAAIAVLTSRGLKTPEAVTALRGAIQQLAAPTPQARKALQELGIEFTTLEDTLRQFAERDFSLADIRKLIPDIQGATAVLTLAQNFKTLEGQLAAMENASGAAQRAYAIIAATPEARMQRFRESVANLLRALGDLVTIFSPLIDGLTALIGAAADAPPPLQAAVVALTGLVVAAKAWQVVGPSLVASFNLLRASSMGLGTSLAAVRVALAGLVAIAAGWQFGTYLRENFALVRNAGYSLVEGLLNVGDRLKQMFQSAGPIAVSMRASVTGAIRGLAADALEALAKMADKLPVVGERMARSLRRQAGQLRTDAEQNRFESAQAERELRALEQQFEARIRARADIFDDLRSAPLDSDGRADRPQPPRPEAAAGTAGEQADAQAREKAEKSARELETLKLELVRERLQAEGREYDAALYAIELKYIDLYERAGDDPQARSLVDAMFDVDLAKARADDILRQAQRLAQGFDARQSARERQAQNATPAERSLLRDAGIEDGRAITEAFADLVEQAREFSGPVGDELAQKLVDIGERIKANVPPTVSWKQELLTLANTVIGDVASGFESFFTGVIAGTKSLSRAFADLASDIVAALQRMIAKTLAFYAVQQLVGIVTGGAYTVNDAGVIAPTKRAAGGYIAGPGGPRDDLIPALLSNGEYVINAASVKRWGRHIFDALNGGTMPRMPRFANGGYVGSSLAPPSRGGDVVQIINNGQPMRVERTERGTTPDGRALLRVVLAEITGDIQRNGPVGRSIADQFGLSPRPKIA